MSGLGTVEFAEAVDLGKVEFAQARDLGTLAEFAGAVDLGTVQTDLEDVPAAADYFATVQSTLGAANIVAHYKLDETTGTVAADATGNGYDGTYTNGPTLGATSLLTQGGGTSVDFDGVNDYVDFGVEPDFDFIQNTGVFTVAAWVEWDGSTGNKTVIASSLSGGSRGWGVIINGTLGIAQGFFNGGSLQIDSEGLSGAGVYFLCYVGDGTVGEIYVNASSVADSAISPGAGAAPLATWIGRYSGSGTLAFPGQIDEVTIANVAATPAQIAALYAYGTT